MLTVGFVLVSEPNLSAELTSLHLALDDLGPSWVVSV